MGNSSICSFWLAVAALLLLVPVFASAVVAPDPKPATVQQYASSNGVNLHTGDMGLDVPLFTVPGRGGLDYPISLHYSAGILVDQQASPIGLGWSLSTGAITRDVVGVPDDWCASCNGDTGDANFLNFHKLATNNDNAQFHFGNFMAALMGNPPSLSASKKNSAGVLVPDHVGNLGIFLTHAFEAGLNAYGYNSEHFSDYATDNDPNQDNPFRLDGFSWRDEAGAGVKSGHDFNSPDIYTMSGDYAGGRLMLLEPQGDDTHLKFHFQKAGGHTTSIENNDGCLAQSGFYSNCQDSFFVFVDRDDSSAGKGQYTNFTVIAPNGLKYLYQPTAWKIVPSVEGIGTATYSNADYSDAYDNCAGTSDLYVYNKFLWNYPTTFGLTEVRSYDSDGTDSKGSKIVISYAYDQAVDITHSRSPYETSQCITGASGRKAWSESFSKTKRLSRIETPTHYAEFNYVFDRLDAKEFSGTRHPARLSSIILYYKNYAPNGSYAPVELKKVVFDNNYYDLMQNSPDSDASGHGRLTLRSISLYDHAYFSSKYAFEYANGAAGGSGDNPLWSVDKVDRWGYYCYYCDSSNYRNLAGAEAGWTRSIPSAWSLTKVTWPTGGWTQYYYESDRYTKLNSWNASPYSLPGSFTIEANDTHYGGGLRVERVKNCDGLGGCYTTKYLYNRKPFTLSENDGISQENVPGDSSGVATNEPPGFTPYHSLDDKLFFGSPQSGAYVGYGTVTEITGFDEATQTAPFGYIVHKFTTAEDYPNTGGVQLPSIAFGEGKPVGVYSRTFDNAMNRFGINFNYPTMFTAPKNTRFRLKFFCGLLNPVLCGSFDVTVGDPIQAEYRCGSDTTACIGFFRENFEGNDQPSYTKVYVDNDNNEDFLLSTMNQITVDACCPDTDGNNQCDILDVAPDRRFSGMKDNDIMRGIEKSTIYYSSSFVLVGNTTSTFSIFPEPHPARLDVNNDPQLVAEWLKTDSVRTVQNGLESRTDYTYDERSAMAASPAKITEYGSNGANRIVQTDFAFQNYPGMLESQPDNPHHLYLPVYETRVYDTFETPAYLYSLSRTSYCKYTAAGDCFDASGIYYRPFAEYSWQKKDSSLFRESDLVKTSENTKFDNFGNVIEFKDAKAIQDSSPPSKAYFSDNTYGECSQTGFLYSHTLLTCTENPFGQLTKYAYNQNNFYGLVTNIIGPNSQESRFAYDHKFRLKYEAPPAPFGKDPYSTKVHFYRMYSETSQPLSLVNLNEVNNSQLLKWSIYANYRTWVNTSAKFDGLGRNLRNVLADPNGPDIITETSYHPLLGLPERSYLPRLESDPLDPAKSTLSVFRKDPLGAVRYSVPVGVTPTWSIAESFSRSATGNSWIPLYITATFSVTKPGYYTVSCTSSTLDAFLMDGSNFNGLVPNYPGDDPLLFRCRGSSEDYVFLTTDRTYLLGALMSGTISINGRYLPQNAAYSEQSYADANKQYFLGIGVDTAGNVTTAKSDKFGRVVEVKRLLNPGGSPEQWATTSSAYDILGRKTTVTDPNGLVTTYYYDNLGRVRRVENPDIGYSESTYDNNGNMLTRNRNGIVTNYAYDALNRMTKVRYSDTDQRKNFFYTYDNYGHPTANLTGRLHFVSTPSTITEYLYDARGQVRSKKTFFHGSCGYGDYAFGCPDITGDGKVDAADQASRTAMTACQSAPIASTSRCYNPFFDFDHDGSVSAAEVTRFDSALNSQGYRPKTWEFFYDYDEAGHRNSTKYPSRFAWQYPTQPVPYSTWTQQYDLLGRMQSSAINDRNGQQATQIAYAYLPEGLLQTETYSNGVGAIFSYNPRYLLREQYVGKDGLAMFQESYEYDPAANIKSLYVGPIAPAYKAADFYYDQLYRLKRVDSQTVTLNGVPSDYYGGDQTYTYDSAGNRQSANIAGTQYTYQYNVQKKNRLENDGTCSYQYTLNGEVSSQNCGGAITSFYYDTDGRLEHVAYGDGGCERYWYDEAGNRVKKQETDADTKFTYYLYDGAQVLQALWHQAARQSC
ncbi:MAG: hypothetical protein V1787_01570 [Candidatus Micrarchaeota archaeon]